jgi:ribosomal protein L29
MASIKNYKMEELKKKSSKDLHTILKDTVAALAHQKLRVRTNEDKKSDRIRTLKTLIARTKTILNQPVQDEK